MSNVKEVISKPSTITIQFIFPSFGKMLSMKVNPRTNLKSWKPLLAGKFGFDFSHMKLAFKS